MAKKKPVADESQFDDMFDAIIDEAKKKYPTGVYTGSEEAMRCIALPLPALAPRVLLQQEGLPFGRFFILDGPKESCKSAMGYELIRWTCIQHGRGLVIEVEDKKSPELGQSIVNYAPKAITIQRCETLQGWSTALSEWLDKITILMDGDPKAPKSRPGIGRLRPVTWLIDSIMAAVADGVMVDVQEHGHTKRRFAEEANLMSDYMKIFTKWLADHPFIVVGINHVKPTQTSQGIPQRHMPGGKAPEYHASIDIEMQRAGKQWKSASTGEEGIPLRMRTQKNSLAPHAEIELEMIWRTDSEPTAAGEYLQRTYFDWHTSTWKILENYRTGGEGMLKKQKLKEIIQFEYNNAKGRVICPYLGISEESPASTHEAGEALEKAIASDPDFARELYAVLGIRRRPLFQYGADFAEQMATAREESKRLQHDREIFVQSRPTVLGTSRDDQDQDVELEPAQKGKATDAVSEG